MMRIWEIPALGMIVGIAALHAIRETGNQKPVSGLFHAFWFTVYFLPVGVLSWFHHSWQLLVMLSLLHVVFYNPVLNFLRHKRFFYIGAPGSLHRSWIDTAIEKIYPPLWIAGTVSWMVLQFVTL